MQRAMGSSEVAHVGSRWLWGVALLGLGALLGATLTRRPAPAKPAETAKGVAVSSAAGPARAAATASVGTELQRKVLALMAEQHPSGGELSDDPQVNEPSTAELLDTVRLQPRDDTWATATQPVLQQDLAQLAAQLRFRVGDVDCRTSRCIVDLEWPNGAAAQRDFKAVIGADVYRLDCHRRLLLPAPESASGHAQLIVNCDNQTQRNKTP
jgi:hypothetical protein